MQLICKMLEGIHKIKNEANSRWAFVIQQIRGSKEMGYPYKIKGCAQEINAIQLTPKSLLQILNILDGKVESLSYSMDMKKMTNGDADKPSCTVEFRYNSRYHRLHQDYYLISTYNENGIVVDIFTLPKYEFESLYETSTN